MTTSTENLLSKNYSINIFPNPTLDRLNIQTKNKIQGIKIYDSFGRLYQYFEVSNNIFEVNTQGYESGFYILEVKYSNDIIMRERFLKQLK